MSKPRIVIVEDSPWLSRQYERVLQHDFETTTAGHVHEAIEYIDDTPPDVIVLDMLLPAANGMVLLHELQSHGDLARIPVIVITSMASDLELADLGAYGVERLLDKTSMEPDDLLVAAKEVLA